MPAYSKTPLFKKLGIKPGDTIAIINFPEDYFVTLGVDANEYKIPQRHRKESIDFIHIFVLTQKEFLKSIVRYKPLLSKDGMMWVSWPKGASGIQTDLKRDHIREALLDAGLVDVKVASFDDRWSGLKFVYRVKDR